MKKKLGLFLVIMMVLTLCAGCTKSETNNMLVVEDGMIRYENNGKMEDVISLEDLLTGKNNTSTIEAKEIELFVEDGYIVWNYIGETSVHKLISLSDLAGSNGLTGPKGDKGDTGATGAKGEKGEDGESSYLHVKYLSVDPANATSSDLLDDPADYLGVCADTNETAPTEVDVYNWYLIKGETGDKGETGATGATGAKGDKGDKGDTGATGPAGSSNFDNVAIYSCSTSKSGENVASTSCVLDYQGSGISTTWDGSSDVFKFLNINEKGTYMVQVQGGVYFKAVNNAGITLTINTSASNYGDTITTKTLKNGATDMFYYFTNSSRVGFTGDVNYIQPIKASVSVPSGTQSGSASYTIDYSITITKLD